jgi:ABC-type polysaccharide/polyol phosphate export permease
VFKKDYRGQQMTLTKKHFVIITFLLSLLLFVPFYLYLPIEIAAHRPGNVPLLVANAGFLSVTAAMLLVILLIVFIRWEFIKSHVATFKRFKYYLYLMVKREFVTRYRRSILGVLWSFLNPILNMLVITMVFSLLFRFDIPNFPVYFISGSIIFSFFSEASSSAMVSVISNSGVIKKIYVPKYLFPISKVLSSLVNLLFAFIAFLVVFLFTGECFRWTMLLIPIPVFFTFVFSLGLGMILSSLAVFFRDITHLYAVVTQLLFFFTPIMYPVSILPDRIYYLIHLNPMFHYVTYFRALVLDGTIPNLWTHLICAGFALAALSLGTFVTMTQQDKYILHV